MNLLPGASQTTTSIALGVECLLLAAGMALIWRRRAWVEPEARPLPRWEAHAFDLGLLILLVLLGSVLVQGLVVRLFGGMLGSDAARLVLGGAGFQLGMLAGCGVFIVSNEAGRAMSLPRLGGISAGFTTFLMCLPPVMLTGLAWGSLLRLCGVEPEHQGLVELLRGGQSPLLVGSLTLFAVVAAPLSEEMVFRAGLFRFLRSLAIPRWAALLIPALIFAMLHGNLASFPQLCVLGVLFAVAYERSGNIGVPMLAHALFNLNTIALILAGVDA